MTNVTFAARARPLTTLIWLLAVAAPGARAQRAGPARPNDGAIPVTIGRGVVPLNGPWRFHTGDDPRWAEPAFDDSGWETMDLTPPPGAHDGDVGLVGYVPGWMARGHAGYRGYAWYRIRIAAAAPSGDTLAIAGPLDVDNCYQLFVNGRLLGASGDFSHALPVAYNTRPHSFPLPQSSQLAPSNTPRVITIAVRVWKEGGALGSAPDAGGIRIAPAIGEASGIDARHRVEWQEKVLGYVVDLVEGIALAVLAVMAFSLLIIDRSDAAYPWLSAALLFTAIGRANQAFFFWTPYESLHLFDLIRNVLLVPLALGAWTMAWRSWFEVRQPAWIPPALGALTVLYVASQAMERSWLSSVVSHRVILGAYDASIGLRLLSAAALLFVVCRGISARKREGWLALPAVVLVSVGLYAQELSMVNVPGIWFPFGVGVSRTQFAYAAFGGFMFIELLRRLSRLAAGSRIGAATG